MRSSSLGILTAGFIALFPFLVSSHLFYGAENIKFFTFIGFVDVLLLWGAYVLWSGKHDFSLKGKWFLYASILVLAVQYLATIFGVDQARSLWSDITRSTGAFFISHVALGAYLLGSLLKKGDWSLIRKTVAISAAVFSFFVFIGVEGFGLTNEVLWFNLNVAGLTIANSTFAGAYLVLALILALIELSRTKEWNMWRYTLLASSVMMLITPLLINTGVLLGTTSLTTLLDSPAQLLGEARSSSAVAYGLLIFMGGMLLLRKLPEKFARMCAFKWSFLWLLGIIAGLAFLFTPGSFVQNAYIQTSTAARIIVWEGAWKSIADRPLLGWGPENFIYAFDTHFDNRLFLEENLGEIWFDRAHNVFIDTLVGSGFIGITTFTLLILALWAVVFRAHRKKLIRSVEAILLVGLPVVHIVQNQTAFDTTATFALLAIIGGYIFWLEKESAEGAKYEFPKNVSKGIAILLVVLSLVSAKFILLDELVRQNALFTTFKTQDNAERLSAIKTSLSGNADFETLRLSSFSFIKGFLQQLGEGKVTASSAKTAKEIIDMYDARYQSFIATHPDHYRARIDYAYLLLVKTIMGEDHLADAKSILKDSYALSPNNPLTYYVEALGETYGGNFKEAKATITKAKALNQDIELSKVIEEYITKQERSFPEISILKLENI